MQDLHQLPKLSDSMSYLYAEHCIIEQNALAVEQIDKRGRTTIPAANLTVLMLGPGTSITHAAIKSLADNGCGIIWVGQDATHFYAQGSGETRQSMHLLHQARLVSDPALRLAVCQRMYRKRFEDELDSAVTIQQLRGKEGARVRMAYEKASILYKVAWGGRNYDRQNWANSDPINRALSSANALLYGVCHAAIVSGGYSPALGFVHTGKQRSFVFDIADLYKVDLTIPIAFQVVGESPHRIGARVRKACRAAFKRDALLKRILPDIAELLDLPKEMLDTASPADADMARPEPLWTPPEEKITETNPKDALVPPVPKPATFKKALSTPQTEEKRPLKTIPFTPKQEKTPLELRRERAEKGMAGKWKVEKLEYLNTWRVITNSGPPGYIVYEKDGHLSCDCPDYDKNELDACKHTFAVAIWRKETA
jgi:CRISP-associated protein Cas1